MQHCVFIINRCTEQCASNSCATAHSLPSAAAPASANPCRYIVPNPCVPSRRALSITFLLHMGHVTIAGFSVMMSASVNVRCPHQRKFPDIDVESIS